jgi:hypothetical protein
LSAFKRGADSTLVNQQLAMERRFTDQAKGASDRGANNALFTNFRPVRPILNFRWTITMHHGAAIAILMIACAQMLPIDAGLVGWFDGVTMRCSFLPHLGQAPTAATFSRK